MTSDEELMLEIRNGSRTAFETLFGRYREPVWRFFRRLNVERLDAEKTNLGRRVSYATIDVTITEERKAGLDGPLSLATRLRVAATDGLESALASVVGMVLFLLRIGPALILWTLITGLGWLLLRGKLAR